MLIFIKELVGFMLVYTTINEFPQGLLFNAKVFADDALLFSVIHDIVVSVSKCIKDLVNVQKLDYK